MNILNVNTTIIILYIEISYLLYHYNKINKFI